MEEKVYVQIAKTLENEIISGAIKEGDVILSTHLCAERFSVNPATAAKGVGLLTAAGVLEKKRGIGLFVAQGARDAIMERRKKEFRETKVAELLAEAHMLGISKTDLLAILMSSK